MKLSYSFIGLFWHACKGKPKPVGLFRYIRAVYRALLACMPVKASQNQWVTFGISGLITGLFSHACLTVCQWVSFGVLGLFIWLFSHACL